MAIVKYKVLLCARSEADAHVTHVDWGLCSPLPAPVPVPAGRSRGPSGVPAAAAHAMVVQEEEYQRRQLAPRARPHPIPGRTPRPEPWSRGYWIRPQVG